MCKLIAADLKSKNMNRFVSSVAMATLEFAESKGLDLLRLSRAGFRRIKCVGFVVAQRHRHDQRRFEVKARRFADDNVGRFRRLIEPKKEGR